MPTREDAWNLLCDWTQTDALRRHGLAVEAAVAWYAANRFDISGDELEVWRSAGLLHDFDYERYPDTHPMRGADELRARGCAAGHGPIDLLPSSISCESPPVAPAAAATVGAWTRGSSPSLSPSH